MNSGLAFLKELKQKLVDGFEKKDPTLIQYGLGMIDDWIDELENPTDPSEGEDVKCNCTYMHDYTCDRDDDDEDCPKCHMFKDNWNFCASCGKRLNTKKSEGK